MGRKVISLPDRGGAPSSEPPSSRSERLALAQLAAGGDARATRVLLETVAPVVLRSVRMMLGRGHPEVEDASQLALLDFVRALGGFRAECEPVHFAVRIAVRKAGATRRRYRRHHDRHDREVDVEQIEATSDLTHGARRRQAVLHLMDDLPEEQAETMAMRFVLGWKLHEIAEATGVPFNTVRSRLRLAKEALLRRIERDPALAAALDAAEDR